MSLGVVATIWVVIISAALLVGCYFWYTRATDKTSRAFSIVVPVVLIPIWGYLAYNCVVNDKCEMEGGRRKRKLR